MKFLVVALFAFFAVGANGHRVNHLTANEYDGLKLFGNIIDKLITEGFEYIRQILKANEPFAVPDLPEQTIVDDDVNLKVQLTEVKLSNASDFVINNLSNNLEKLSGTFEVTLPSLFLEGKHSISGTAFNEDVEGSGTFAVYLTKFVQDGQIQFAVNNHSLQISTLALQYDLDAAKFQLTGLETTSMSNSQIEEFLNSQLLTTLKQNQAFVCTKVANHVKEIANGVMKGKSLFDLIKWLKDNIKN